MTTRRDFLQTSAAILAAGCARVAPNLGIPSVAAATRGRLGFSTLGCPNWDWNRIVDFAATNGYSAIELRGVGPQMDLTRVPQFAPAAFATTMIQIADRVLRAVGLCGSATMFGTYSSI